MDGLLSQNMERREDGLWHCRLCEYSSKKTTNVRHHIESKHFQGSGFNCPHCYQVCPTRNALNMHIHRKHKL